MTTLATGIPTNSPIPVLPSSVFDLFSLKGKTALITGASAGIGLAVAEAFAEAGANIALGYNSSHTAVEIAAKLAARTGVEVIAYKCPVTDWEAVEKTFADAKAHFGKIDIVVANAGVAWTAGAMTEPKGHSEWNEVVNVDINGAYYTAKCAGLVFQEQGFGNLIFTSSVSAKTVNIPQKQACYNMCKAAVTQLTKCLAVEWAGLARVNCISPGYTITEITKFADPAMRQKWLELIPMGRECITRELVGAYLPRQ